MSVIPTVLRIRADVQLSATVGSLLDYRPETTVHVDAVVGIADGGVQLGQVVLVVSDHLAEVAQPGQDCVSCDHWLPLTGSVQFTCSDSASVTDLDCTVTCPYTPQRRPGVFTGASHSLSSSSSAFSRVIEQPAISSEVM